MMTGRVPHPPATPGIPRHQGRNPDLTLILTPWGSVPRSRLLTGVLSTSRELKKVRTPNPPPRTEQRRGAGVSYRNRHPCTMPESP